MQGTLVFQPLLSSQVTIPATLSSASLAEPLRLIQFRLSTYTDKVLSLVSCSVSLHTRSAVHSCLAISTFLTPRNLSVPQPVSPGLSPHARSRIPCHLSCGYFKPIPIVGFNRAWLACLAGDLGGHTCRFRRNLSKRQDRTIRASPNDQ